MADDESGTRDSDEGIRSSAAPKADAEAVPEAKLLTSCRDALGLVQRFSTISDFGEPLYNADEVQQDTHYDDEQMPWGQMPNVAFLTSSTDPDQGSVESACTAILAGTACGMSPCATQSLPIVSEEKGKTPSSVQLLLNRAANCCFDEDGKTPKVRIASPRLRVPVQNYKHGTQLLDLDGVCITGAISDHSMCQAALHSLGFYSPTEVQSPKIESLCLEFLSACVEAGGVPIALQRRWFPDQTQVQQNTTNRLWSCCIGNKCPVYGTKLEVQSFYASSKRSLVQAASGAGSSSLNDTHVNCDTKGSRIASETSPSQSASNEACLLSRMTDEFSPMPVKAMPYVHLASPAGGSLDAVAISTSWDELWRSLNRGTGGIDFATWQTEAGKELGGVNGLSAGNITPTVDWSYSKETREMGCSILRWPSIIAAGSSQAFLQMGILQVWCCAINAAMDTPNSIPQKAPRAQEIELHIRREGEIISIEMNPALGPGAGSKLTLAKERLPGDSMRILETSMRALRAILQSLLIQERKDLQVIGNAITKMSFVLSRHGNKSSFALQKAVAVVDQCAVECGARIPPVRPLIPTKTGYMSSVSELPGGIIAVAASCGGLSGNVVVLPSASRLPDQIQSRARMLMDDPFVRETLLHGVLSTGANAWKNVEFDTKIRGCSNSHMVDAEVSQFEDVLVCELYPHLGSVGSEGGKFRFGTRSNTGDVRAYPSSDKQEKGDADATDNRQSRRYIQALLHAGNNDLTLSAVLCLMASETTVYSPAAVRPTGLFVPSTDRQTYLHQSLKSLKQFVSASANDAVERATAFRGALSDIAVKWARNIVQSEVRAEWELSSFRCGGAAPWVCLCSSATRLHCGVKAPLRREVSQYVTPGRVLRPNGSLASDFAIQAEASLVVDRMKSSIYTTLRGCMELIAQCIEFMAKPESSQLDIEFAFHVSSKMRDLVFTILASKGADGHICEGMSHADIQIHEGSWVVPYKAQPRSLITVLGGDDAWLNALGMSRDIQSLRLQQMGALATQYGSSTQLNGPTRQFQQGAAIGGCLFASLQACALAKAGMRFYAIGIPSKSKHSGQHRQIISMYDFAGKCHFPLQGGLTSEIQANTIAALAQQMNLLMDPNCIMFSTASMVAAKFNHQATKSPAIIAAEALMRMMMVLRQCRHEFVPVISFAASVLLSDAFDSSWIRNGVCAGLARALQLCPVVHGGAFRVSCLVSTLRQRNGARAGTIGGLLGGTQRKTNLVLIQDAVMVPFGDSIKSILTIADHSLCSSLAKTIGSTGLFPAGSLMLKHTEASRASPFFISICRADRLLCQTQLKETLGHEIRLSETSTIGMKVGSSIAELQYDFNPYLDMSLAVKAMQAPGAKRVSNGTAHWAEHVPVLSAVCLPMVPSRTDVMACISDRIELWSRCAGNVASVQLGTPLADLVGRKVVQTQRPPFDPMYVLGTTEAMKGRWTGVKKPIWDSAVKSIEQILTKFGPQGNQGDLSAAISASDEPCAAQAYQATALTSKAAADRVDGRISGPNRLVGDEEDLQLEVADTRSADISESKRMQQSTSHADVYRSTSSSIKGGGGTSEALAVGEVQSVCDDELLSLHGKHKNIDDVNSSNSTTSIIHERVINYMRHWSGADVWALLVYAGYTKKYNLVRCEMRNDRVLIRVSSRNKGAGLSAFQWNLVSSACSSLMGREQSANGVQFFQRQLKVDDLCSYLARHGHSVAAIQLRQTKGVFMDAVDSTIAGICHRVESRAQLRELAELQQCISLQEPVSTYAEMHDSPLGVPRRTGVMSCWLGSAIQCLAALPTLRMLLVSSQEAWQTPMRHIAARLITMISSITRFSTSAISMALDELMMALPIEVKVRDIISITSHVLEQLCSPDIYAEFTGSGMFVGSEGASELLPLTVLSIPVELHLLSIGTDHLHYRESHVLARYDDSLGDMFAVELQQGIQVLVFAGSQVFAPVRSRGASLAIPIGEILGCEPHVTIALIPPGHPRLPLHGSHFAVAWNTKKGVFQVLKSIGRQQVQLKIVDRATGCSRGLRGYYSIQELRDFSIKSLLQRAPVCLAVGINRGYMANGRPQWREAEVRSGLDDTLRLCTASHEHAYRLHAVTMCSDSMDESGGHVTVMRTGRKRESQQWFHVDDASVEACTPEEFVVNTGRRGTVYWYSLISSSLHRQQETSIGSPDVNGKLDMSRPDVSHNQVATRSKIMLHDFAGEESETAPLEVSVHDRNLTDSMASSRGSASVHEKLSVADIVDETPLTSNRVSQQHVYGTLCASSLSQAFPWLGLIGHVGKQVSAPSIKSSSGHIESACSGVAGAKRSIGVFSKPEAPQPPPDIWLHQQLSSFMTGQEDIVYPCNRVCMIGRETQIYEVQDDSDYSESEDDHDEGVSKPQLTHESVTHGSNRGRAASIDSANGVKTYASSSKIEQEQQYFVDSEGNRHDQAIVTTQMLDHISQMVFHGRHFSCKCASDGVRACDETSCNQFNASLVADLVIGVRAQDASPSKRLTKSLLHAMMSFVFMRCSRSAIARDRIAVAVPIGAQDLVTSANPTVLRWISKSPRLATDLYIVPVVEEDGHCHILTFWGVGAARSDGRGVIILDFDSFKGSTESSQTTDRAVGKSRADPTARGTTSSHSVILDIISLQLLGRLVVQRHLLVKTWPFSRVQDFGGMRSATVFLHILNSYEAGICRMFGLEGATAATFGRMVCGKLVTSWAKSVLGPTLEYWRSAVLRSRLGFTSLLSALSKEPALGVILSYPVDGRDIACHDPLTVLASVMWEKISDCAGPRQYKDQLRAILAFHSGEARDSKRARTTQSSITTDSRTFKN